MIEHNRWDYVAMYVPNVLAEVQKGRILAQGEVAPHGGIMPLLDALVKKFPRWQFIGQTHYAHSCTPHFFRIYESGEELGSISYGDHYKHGGQYIIRNKRIADARARGYEARTVDLKKATRMVVDNFGAKTMDELIRDSANELLNSVNRVQEPRRRSFHEMWSLIEGFAKHYIAEHWDELKHDIAQHANLPANADFPAKYNALDEANNLSNAYRGYGKRGTIVVIKDASYALKRGGDDPVIVTSDLLPRNIKAKLGMLKLLEDGDFVPDVGVRSRDNLYFVMDDPNG